jgi:hypothetical protein
MSRECSTNEGKMNACRLLVEQLEGERALGRSSLRRAKNINMHL